MGRGRRHGLQDSRKATDRLRDASRRIQTLRHHHKTDPRPLHPNRHRYRRNRYRHHRGRRRLPRCLRHRNRNTPDGRHHRTILRDTGQRENYRNIPWSQGIPRTVSQEKLSRTIIVAGIPGVGKTTVLQELETVAREKSIPLKIVNFGNVMNELFKKRGRTVHRDHMRRQDLELQAKVQEQAAREIGKTGGKSALVVDTHMFVKTKDGIWPGTPRRVLEALDPGLIILIEADPEDIARRRNADRTRERDSKTVDEARTDLEWSRYMASANAVLAGAPIQIVLNPDGHQRRAAEDLLALIQKRTLQ
ncbi:adenylate kinase [Candidatus Bathyarchaeota archaeon]|nr:MAG: adenylate kinase [Candidatus Bathyarchaeota archaeon]